ncbi:MAG: ankyrin repeat domain-containing protein [Gemmatimonadota bacterium]
MSAPRRPLPAQPSLEQQKKLAKDLLRAHRAADPDATARIRQHLPDKRDIGLADAQFTLAREYGFADWAALAAHVAASEALRDGALHETFRRAFAAGDLSELRALFERHPVARRMIDAPLFSFDAPALVHFAGQGNLQMVELLLELGADPNRRSDWWAGGFHTLHVAKGEVAQRLLAAGADPDACGAAHLDRPDLLARMIQDDPSCVHQRGGDGQTPLHFARSREVVDLLLAHGADIDALDVDHRASPAQWMLERRRDAGRFPLAAYLVQRGARADVFLAAALGRADLLREMLEADPTLLGARTGQGDFAEQPPSSVHIYTWTIGQNLSPLQVAAQFDQEEAFQVLQAFATPRQRFLAACVRGNAAEAHALLREHPHVMDELTPADQRALPDAAWAGQARPVELMLELGFDPAARGQDGGTLLHCAAWEGALECVQVALRHPGVRALLEVRDPTHGSTPLGWCCHGSRYCARPEGDYPGVARLLLKAGAEPGPNRNDATEEVLAVLRAARG